MTGWGGSMNKLLFFKTALVLSVICVLGGQIMAQDPKPSPTVAPQQQPTAIAPQPTANPADVSSPDAIINAVYNVISGPAGKERDWDRLKSLFIPGARLIATGRRQAGGYGSRVMTVDDYILSSGPYLIKEGFFENEIARKTESFGQILHAFSTYEARHKPGEKPFRSEEHTSELQSLAYLVCRLLLEKK